MLKTQGIERSLGMKCSEEGREAGYGLAAAWMTRLCRDALRGLGSSEGTGRTRGALGGSWSSVNNNLKENGMTQLHVQGLCGEEGW